MPSTVIPSFIAVLQAESDAVAGLVGWAQHNQELIGRACTLIKDGCASGAGRLVVTGVGKAGLIGRKVCATFASTGTPALFLHPAEARHGDLGMVQPEDVVLAFSNSGASDEVLALLPSLKHIGCRLIAIVGNAESPLGRHADLALAYGPVVEACPLGMAPSTSTTVMLALGDAIALTVLGLRDFTHAHYARFHPGGALGRKLMTCGEAMRDGKRVPAVLPTTTVMDSLRAITGARAGSVVLVDEQRRLVGIFTDGDLRRSLSTSPDPGQVMSQLVREHATVPCLSVRAEELVQTALHVCSEKHINELPVVAEDGTLLGLLDLQDLADRGFAI